MTEELVTERENVLERLHGYDVYMSESPSKNANRLFACITGNKDAEIACGNDLEDVRDKLIELLSYEKVPDGSKESFKETMDEARCCLRDGEERMEDAIDELQGAYDRDTQNPSHLYTFKSVQDDSLMLANAREYGRGYRDGLRARDSEEWTRDQERAESVRRLTSILRSGQTPSNDELFDAILGDGFDGDACKRLLWLLGGGISGEMFCDRYGWCGFDSGACKGRAFEQLKKEHALVLDLQRENYALRVAYERASEGVDCYCAEL